MPEHHHAAARYAEAISDTFKHIVCHDLATVDDLRYLGLRLTRQLTYLPLREPGCLEQFVDGGHIADRQRATLTPQGAAETWWIRGVGSDAARVHVRNVQAMSVMRRSWGPVPPSGVRLSGIGGPPPRPYVLAGRDRGYHCLGGPPAPR